MINIDSVNYPELLFLKIKSHIQRTKKIHRDNLFKFFFSAFWRLSSLSRAVKLCRYPFPSSENSKRAKTLDLVWRRNFRFMLGQREKIGRNQLARRRLMLNSALYHLQPEMMKMINLCAESLERVKSQVIADGHIPVFAPFHTLSDVLAGIAVTMTSIKRTHIYSIYDNGYLGNEASAKLVQYGLEVIHHHPAEPSSQQRVIFRELKSARANVVIFPDALPQCTANFMNYPMPSHRVTLFGRPASLHSGAEKIAKLVGGKLIPFYLFWDDDLEKLSIRIFAPCDDGKQLASCMEQALKECGDQWPLWHYTSLFYFNDAGRQAPCPS